MDIQNGLNYKVNVVKTIEVKYTVLYILASVYTRFKVMRMFKKVEFTLPYETLVRLITGQHLMHPKSVPDMRSYVFFDLHKFF